MKTAVSSGIIPYRTTRDKVEYLILKSRTKDWEFPKGSLEDEEELQQAALREVQEETGITGIQIVDGFREDYSYIFESAGSTIHKTVHLFIGHSMEASANLSNEHNDYQWRTYEQAKSTLTHTATKEILKKAHEHIAGS